MIFTTLVAVCIEAGEARVIQLVAVSNLTDRCHLILNTGPLQRGLWFICLNHFESSTVDLVVTSVWKIKLLNLDQKMYKREQKK